MDKIEEIEQNASVKYIHTIQDTSDLILKDVETNQDNSDLIVKSEVSDQEYDMSSFKDEINFGDAGNEETHNEGD